MTEFKEFESLRELKADVLAEVVREAEARLEAQLTIASAADQRALTLAGFQITGATAALAGGIALTRGVESDLWLAFLALVFAVAMVAAASLAVATVRPTKFSIPGNRPSNWKPELWMGGKEHGYGVAQARIEQAVCLDDAIACNTELMEIAATRVTRSIDLTIITVATAGLVLFGTVVARATM